jgi:hypothetical protein
MQPVLIAGLPTTSDPASHLLSDLQRLNRIRPSAGQAAPLAIWLTSAFALSRARSEAEIFREVLDELGIS